MMNVNVEKCIGCSLCIKDCPVKDIELKENKAFIKNETCIKCGHCIAICPKDAVTTDDYNMEEIKDYDKDTFTLDSENLLNFIKFRRSTRQFKNIDVETEKLVQIIEAGRFTQTGTNSQNVSYIVVKDKINELKDIVFETLKGMGEHMLSNPELDPNLKKYATMWLRMYEGYKIDPIAHDTVFFNAPVLILTVCHSPIDASLASSNMELMVNALGLGTFFSGFFTKAAEVNKMINQVLGLSETAQIVTCMVIGYPSISYKRTAPRKEATISWQ